MGKLIQQKEYVLTFVGTATAVGLHVDIGMVVRSLADSLAWTPKTILPIPLDRQLAALITARNGSKTTKDVRDMVDQYRCNWWVRPEAPLFGPATVSDCLEFHRQRQKEAGVFAAPPAVPLPPPSTPARRTFTASFEPPCTTCVLSQHACAAMQSDLVQIKSFAAAQAEISSARTALTRQTMAAAHCFKTAYLDQVKSAQKSGQPLPAGLTEADVAMLTPVAAVQIANTAPAISSAAAKISPAMVERISAGLESFKLDAGLRRPMFPPAVWHAGPRAGQTPAAQLPTGNENASLPGDPDDTVAIDMFGSSDEESNTGVPDTVDMFGSDEEPAAASPNPAVDKPDAAAGKGTTVAMCGSIRNDAATPAAAVTDKAGTQGKYPSPGAHDAIDMFGSDEEDARQGDHGIVDMFGSDEDTDAALEGAAGIDMFGSDEEPVARGDSRLTSNSDDSDDVIDMFGSDAESGGLEGSNVASSGDEGSDDGLVDMIADDDSRSLPRSSGARRPRGRFNAEHFAGLDDSLFVDPAGGDSE